MPKYCQYPFLSTNLDEIVYLELFICILSFWLTKPLTVTNIANSLALTIELFRKSRSQFFNFLPF